MYQLLTNLKLYVMKKILFFLSIIFPMIMISQPTNVHHNFNDGNWTTSPGDALTSRGLVKVFRYQAVNSGTRNFLFNDASNWWKAPDGNAYTANTKSSHSTGNSTNPNMSATGGYYYTFICENTSNATINFSVLETAYNPNTITSVSHSPLLVDDGQGVTVTATLSGTLNSGEYAYVRYSTDAWTTSSLISMSLVSGTNYFATIPAQSVGTSVSYYVLTSNLSSFSVADADYFTLELDNNSGSNYSYTVNYYSTAQNGDWETASTWTANSVPPANAYTKINHDITVNSSVTNNPDKIVVMSSKSITWGAGGGITANVSITNDGTINMTSGGALTIANNATLTNNSTFTAGTGKVVFAGAGTVSGTITFNNAEVKGAVDFGGSAFINGILSINGGNLTNNSITYNSGSTLQYETNYSVNSGDQSWYSNVASSGSAQVGIPWNVEIPASVSVSLNDSYPFSINGNITIDGTFTLGTDGGSHWGDFYLRGNFTLNSGATFTHNSRSVKFNGTSLQNINGSLSPTFAYLEINNSAGLQLAQHITVANQFTFTNGKIILGNFNVSLGSSTITGNDASKYFVTDGAGYLIRNVSSTEVVFPVGITSEYAPAFLTQAGTAEDLYVRVKQGIDNATLDDDFIVNLQWTIDEQTPGSNSITTKFQWNSADENVNFDRSSKSYIGRYIGGSYSSDIANIAGTDPFTASASGMADDISAEIPFVIGNTIAFSSDGYKTAQNGDWNTGSTWVGGNVPPANKECYILHHLTIGGATNDANAVTIYADKSVTMNASASLTVNGKLVNNGMLKTNDATASLTINGTLLNNSEASVNMVGDGKISFTNTSTFDNQGSFTSGIGTIDFLQDGVASGNLPFHNIIVAGNVDVGTNASVDGTLKLTSSGNLINNGIKYLTGSLLTFDRNFSLADDKIWYRNSASTGTEQFGIPCNVQINSSYTLDVSDSYFRAINGDIVIDGTFTLSTTSGGDFKLRGDFNNNGTFNDNSRSVEFNGNTKQTIKGSPVTFGYLTVNNNANVILACNVIVNNNLDFTKGKIIIYSYNLTVNGLILNSSLAKYVVTNGSGYLIQNVGASQVTFPVGTLTAFRPAYLTQNGTAENLSVRVQNSIDNAVNDPTQIVNLQWTINEQTSGSNNLDVQFEWKTEDETSGFTRNSNLEIAYYSGGYNNAAATLAGGDPYTATRTGIASNLVNLPFIVANTGAFSGGFLSNGTGGGNWNISSTWQGGVVPGTGNSAVILNGDVVTLDIDPTVKSISVQSGGTLTCGAHIITLDNGGAIANSGTFNANTGKVIFSGTGTISTGSITFNDVDLNGAVSFGSNTAIGGIMTINSGGSVYKNAPVYNSTSTLKYNQGGNISRADEWRYNISETDPGYPANVQISNNTIFDVDADNNDDYYYQTRAIKGNLTIDIGSEITLNDMGGGTNEDQICGVYVKGNIVNNGTITLSSNYGGDMMLEGDITNSGTINWSSRAIFFTGANTVNQNITGLSTIPFILITNGSNVILNNDITVNGSGTEFITFARPSSEYTGSIDLNGNTLTCSGDGNIELNDLAGAQVTGTGRVEVSGGNASFSGTNSGTLEFGSNVTLAINGGTMTFPSSLGIVTIYGTLEIGDNATISNIPTYGNSSTLHYKKGGSFTMGVEWGAGSNIADNIPFNITVSQGADAAILNMNKTRYALGTLLIENNATLEVAEGTGQLTVNNLTVNSGGKIVLKSPNDNTVAGSFISTGTVTNNGTMQAERYTSAGKYTYICPPNLVTNSQLFTNNSNGYFNPNFYYYNEAFESPVEPPSATYSIWKENDTYHFNNAWVAAHDGEGGSGTTLNTAGRGYAYYNDINKKFVFDGTFTTGDQTVTLYYDDNDNDNSANSGYFDGWNLIANPFPSALDWTDASWNKTYVDGTVYYWDGTSGADGNYKYYSSSTYNDGTNVVNGGSQMIPASQAFFVKAKSTAGTSGKSFTIPNAARVHSTQDFWGKSSSKNTKTSAGFIRLQVTANNNTDELVVRYIPEGTIGYDGDFDAYKMYAYSPNTPQIYSFNEQNGAGYAINSLPVSTMNTDVLLGLEIGKANSSCTISLTDKNMLNTHIYLKDNLKSVKQNLTVNSDYQLLFEDSADVRDRFVISFEENTAPILENEIPDYSVNFGDTIKYKIPENTFSDANEGDILTYSVLRDNDEQLPDWLTFDRNTGGFYGIPPKAGSCLITVTVTDIFGATKDAQFVMSVKSVLADISTDEVTNIGTETAEIKATIISTGGEALDSVGVCWSTSHNPTVNDYLSETTTNTGAFSITADNLMPNTTYYARAYAINSAGIKYGNELIFSTLIAGVDDVVLSEISIYPNPASDYIYVKSPDDEVVTISIIDIRGKIIQTKIISDKKDNYIDVRSLTKGAYLIKIKTINTVNYRKILIK